MILPTVKQCFLYFDQYEMRDNIRAHSIMVTRVAQTLYDHLRLRVPKENLPEKRDVIIGALMHDIAKTPCLGTEKEHAKEGKKICDALGYPELGNIVAEHVLLREFREKDYQQGCFGAKEFVFYSDKRVNHDQIANLAEREEYIIGRYGRNDAWRIGRIHDNFAQTYKLESYLFLHLDFQPEQMQDSLASYSENFGLDE